MCGAKNQAFMSLFLSNPRIMPVALSRCDVDDQETFEEIRSDLAEVLGLAFHNL